MRLPLEPPKGLIVEPVAHTERAHSELGASSCPRWWNCPASVRLQRGQPDNAGPEAQKGTAAHEVAEMCLRSGQDAIEFHGRVVNGVEIDDKISEGVQVYLDDVRSLIPDVILPSQLQIEVGFDLAPLNPPAPMFGTADAVAYVPVWRKLYVKDYKNGFIHVDATSEQLRYYALGAMLTAPGPVSEVEVTIVQPNGLGEAVRRATFDATELAEWSIELMDRARATQEPDAPAVAGKWCTHCRVRATCSARASAALAGAQVEFTNEPMPWCGDCDGQGGTPQDRQIPCVACGGTGEKPTPIIPAIRPPEIRLLTAEQIAGILTSLPILEGWIKDVEKHALALLSRGEAVPGWKLAPNRPSTKWINPDDAAAMLGAVHEIDPYEPREVLSFAKARDKLAEVTRPNFKTKKDATEAAAKALRPMTRTASTGVVLAPDSDPRAAVSAGGSEFECLPAPSSESP